MLLTALKLGNSQNRWHNFREKLYRNCHGNHAEDIHDLGLPQKMPSVLIFTRDKKADPVGILRHW